MKQKKNNSLHQLVTFNDFIFPFHWSAFRLSASIADKNKNVNVRDTRTKGAGENAIHALVVIELNENESNTCNFMLLEQIQSPFVSVHHFSCIFQLTFVLMNIVNIHLFSTAQIDTTIMANRNREKRRCKNH